MHVEIHLLTNIEQDKKELLMGKNSKTKGRSRGTVDVIKKERKKGSTSSKRSILWSIMPHFSLAMFQVKFYAP